MFSIKLIYIIYIYLCIYMHIYKQTLFFMIFNHKFKNAFTYPIQLFEFKFDRN